MRASMFVTLGMGGLAVIVASLFVMGYALAVGRTGGSRVHARMRTRTAMMLWMTMFALLAERGVLARFDDRPQPLGAALLASVFGGLLVAVSPVGTTLMRGLPLSWLIAVQAFRLPLEIVMHQAAREGVMPVEMSFAGYNFDILTGASAIVVAYLASRGRASRRLIFAWNVLGSVLLAVIVTVAVLASPLIRAFGDDPAHVNTWIAHFPFIWLPTVLVAAALIGHVVIFRALRASSRPSSPELASPEPSSPPPSS